MGVLTREPPPKGSPWTEAELDFLRTEYSTAGVMAVSRALGRSRDSVAIYARRADLMPEQAFINWTPELDDVVRDFFDLSTAKTIADLLGCSRSAIYGRARDLGVKKSAVGASETTRRAILERSVFTPEIAEIIELLYADCVTEEIAALLGISTNRILAYAHRHGWKKSRAHVSAHARLLASQPDHPGKRTRFQKGLVPWNKGLKGLQHPGSLATQFAKGNRPHTWLPIGTVRINSDGCLEQKVEESDNRYRAWMTVHRLVWIKANGPVPPGHLVVFKPGCKTNKLEEITLDVVECISRGENARRNHPRSRSPELGRLVVLKGVMTRAIRKYGKLQADHTGVTR